MQQAVTITAYPGDFFDLYSGLSRSLNVRRSQVLAHTRITTDLLDIAAADPGRPHTFFINVDG